MKASTTLPAALRWKRRQWWRQACDLLSERGTEAELVFPKWYSTRSVCRTPSEGWEIYEPRFFSHDLAIRKVHTELPFAHIRVGWFGSSATVELPKGRRLQIGYELWKRRYTVTGEREEVLFTLELVGLTGSEGRITATEAGQALPEFLWLTAAVWYIALRRAQRAHRS